MIIDSLKAVAKKMMIDFEDVTSKIQHNGEKGTSREELLSVYLRSYIPNKYEIGRGTIIDSDGNQSKQQDFIIYDSFSSPVLLNMDSTKMIPIESVYAIVEVKSSLNKERMKECVANIKSVKQLTKNPITNYIAPTAGFVFSYTSDTSLDAIFNNFVEFNKDVEYMKQISAVFILDKGSIVNISKNGLNNIALIPNKDTIPAIVNNTMDNNLLLFYLMLMHHLNSILVSPPNLMKYVEKEGITKVKFMLPEGHIPIDAYYNLKGRKVSVDNVMSILKNNEEFKILTSGKADSKQIMKYLSENLEKITLINESATGSKYGTFSFFGKDYSNDYLVGIMRIYRRIQNNEDNSIESINICKELENELYEQYIKYFNKVN